MVFCTQCGRRAEPDHRYCAGCGHAVRAANQAPAPASVEAGPLQGALKALLSGKPAAAVSLLEPLVESSPEHAVARSYLGLAYLRLARVSDAREQLERAVELAPDSFICRSKYAELLAKLGFYDQAVAQLDVALACGPPDADSRTAALELRRFCSERTKDLFYRRLASPRQFRWSNLLPRGARIQHIEG